MTANATAIGISTLPKGKTIYLIMNRNQGRRRSLLERRTIQMNMAINCTTIITTLIIKTLRVITIKTINFNNYKNFTNTTDVNNYNNNKNKTELKNSIGFPSTKNGNPITAFSFINTTFDPIPRIFIQIKVLIMSPCTGERNETLSILDSGSGINLINEQLVNEWELPLIKIRKNIIFPNKNELNSATTQDQQVSITLPDERERKTTKNQTLRFSRFSFDVIANYSILFKIRVRTITKRKNFFCKGDTIKNTIY